MRATTLSTIVISLLATIANCEINQPLNETGLDPSNTKYNAFNPEWPDSNNFKVAIYNYQTTYWVFHYQNGTDDYIGQRWGCNTQSLCQWYVHKDTAVLGRYRRFQNVATGYCLRVGDGTLNCANANAIPNNTPITPATCKSYAEDNCQYFSQGGHYISSNQYVSFIIWL
ncbi:uncharacterized protein LOC118437588 [Folsomia candida]|uniref:uncharacterized protein LOC118437588 n=1 Tax=Folsomia candida TaxID=158441 RepID=UPI001604DCB3|nr:uncharacterized protein LOC118437588 [Folsomia candida]